MLDVSVTAAAVRRRMADLALDIGDEAAVIESGVEQLRLQIPVRSVASSDRVRHRSAKRNLDPLHRVHDKQPQLSIEDIAVKDVVEGDAGPEIMPISARASDLERQRVARQAIVADMGQIV